MLLFCTKKQNNEYSVVLSIIKIEWGITMSFYSGNRQGCMPGPINGNPLNGLCEKACIQTTKVFDACMKQIQEQNLRLTITPEGTYTDPLTFVSVTQNLSDVTLTNLSVDRFEDRPCFARVTGDVNIPITITFTDATGATGTGTTTITINQDVILYVPQPSIVPYRVVAFASVLGVDGDYVGDNVFELDACITVILRVVVDAEILVPSYGYCKIPQCQEFTQDVCSGFFDLPLYPTQQPVSNN